MVERPEGNLSLMEEVFVGDSDMSLLMRSFDWSKTPLGPVDRWPQSLRSAVGLMLTNQFPMDILWGPELVQLYNDAYRDIAGDKHPAALGQSNRETWPEVWHINRPIYDAVMSDAESIYLEDQLFPINRRGYLEETYFTLCFSPILDKDGEVAGILETLTESTNRILSERRLKALYELGSQATKAHGTDETARVALEVLSNHEKDVPFALLYLVGESRQTAKLASATHSDIGPNAQPTEIDLTDPNASIWPLSQVLQTSEPRAVGGVSSEFRPLHVGAWPEPPSTAYVVPLCIESPARPDAVLILGVNARRALDEPYRHFLQAVASHIETSMGNAAAYDAERGQAYRKMRELAESLDEQAEVMDLSHVLVRDMDDRIVSWNRGMQDLYGWTKEEAIGKISYELLQTVFPEPMEKMASDIQSLGYWHGELAQKTKYGEVIVVASHQVLHRDPDGNPTAILESNNDITNCKQAEEALRQSEQILRDRYNAIAAGIVVHDSEGVLVYANKAAGDILGVEIDELEGRVSFDPRWKSIHEDGSPFPGEDHPAMVTLLNGKPVDNVVMGVYSPQFEEYRWILVNSRPIIESTTGNLREVVATFVDISDRKNAEEELRDLAKRLNSHIKNSPLAAVEWNSDYRIIRWSDEATYVFGWTAEEMMGKRIDDVRWVYEEDWPIVAKLMEDMNAGIRPRNVNPNRNYRKDGTIIYCEWYNSVLRDSAGCVTSILSLVLDVTEREKARQELTEARAYAEEKAAQMESFITSMSEGVVLLGSDGRPILANDAAIAILGSDPRGTVSDRVQQYRVHNLDGTPMHPEDTASYRALKGESVKDNYYRLSTVTGEERTILVSSSPVRTADGHIIGAATVFRDVTGQVEFERQKQELYEREHHIAEVLQKALIPDTTYEIPGYDVAVRYEPALKEAMVGGDFYDIFDLGDNNLGLLIGDVAGKGLSAAIQVAAARHSVRSYAYMDPRPGRVMTLVNNALCRESEQRVTMLTSFFAIIDTEVGVMTYANGGHETPMIRHADGSVEDLAIEGRAVGVMQGYDYPERSVILRPGDLVVMVTDGIIEARPNSTDLFGAAGMREYLSGKQGYSADDLADGLLEAAKSHAGGLLRDDAAILVFGIENGKITQ